MTLISITSFPHPCNRIPLASGDKVAVEMAQTGP